ncbi:L,D-transpeptidase family protein [Hyphomicrobiaceae bacterium 22]|uniref:L,D-transpeptidase family protein n=1 Tax=Prosthecodimorpha staleyi TaxID=2840188 RepID=A0A947DAB9_9HYPH|nr:L,D-transpeptidase family protein [Prosthecodimorpha staleyi]
MSYSDRWRPADLAEPDGAFEVLVRPKPDHGLRLTRRGLLTGIAALAGLRAVPALAESAGESPIDVLMRAQTVREWQDKFDAGASTPVAQLKSDVPLLSPETAANIEAALPQYQAIAGNGGWPRVPDQQRLRIGTRSEAVMVLRQRLAVTGDLAPSQFGYGDTFDSYVDAAVRRFQVRHGLKPNGLVDKPVFDVMNVPADIRLRQLETNLVRVRSMSGNLGDRFIFVNIPAAELEAVEGGRVIARHNAVVGKVDRQTPVLTSKVSEINFNPFWHVPVSIIRKDLIPKMRADPEYLTKNRIRIYDNKGREIPPEAINWDTDQAANLAFRQDPGDINAMATVKISFPNSHDVYMHDTPFKDLFGDNNRFYSSGCMRIQNVRELVAWILRDTPNWGPQQIDDAIRTGQRIDAKVKGAVQVYTNYVTAWATREGVVHFRDDIYARDGIGELAYVPGIMQ